MNPKKIIVRRTSGTVSALDAPCPICLAQPGTPCTVGVGDGLQAAVIGVVGVADTLGVARGGVHLARHTVAHVSGGRR
jgi:hypothetical protein